MGALAERFAERKGGTKVRLHAVSSESQYPHPHFLGLEFPFDGNCRTEDIETVHALLTEIGVPKTDILLIDETYGISLYFQNASDHMHFRLANEIDDASLEMSNVEFGLALKDQESGNRGKLKRARNDFEKARKKAQIPKDHCEIRMCGKDGTIDVRTETVSEYLAIYRNLSRRTKQRLALLC